MKLLLPLEPRPPTCSEPAGVLTPNDVSPVFLFSQNVGLIGPTGTVTHLVPSGDTETGPTFAATLGLTASPPCATAVTPTANKPAMTILDILILPTPFLVVPILTCDKAKQ
jgi:hypothetical protein